MKIASDLLMRGVFSFERVLGPHLLPLPARLLAYQRLPESFRSLSEFVTSPRFLDFSKAPALVVEVNSVREGVLKRRVVETGRRRKL